MRSQLRNPVRAWGEDVWFQLAMIEEALEPLEEGLSARQLGDGFRARCKETRHKEEVPRLRGLFEIPALHFALHQSQTLRQEALWQIDTFKSVYASGVMRGFGRFRKLDIVPGETLLELMKRTHSAAQQWRPQG